MSHVCNESRHHCDDFCLYLFECQFSHSPNQDQTYHERKSISIARIMKRCRPRVCLPFDDNLVWVGYSIVTQVSRIVVLCLRSSVAFARNVDKQFLVFPKIGQLSDGEEERWAKELVDRIIEFCDQLSLRRRRTTTTETTSTWINNFFLFWLPPDTCTFEWSSMFPHRNTHMPWLPY